MLIGGQMQAGLNLGVIQYSIVFAPHHEREASQISEYRSGAILP